MTIVEEQPAWMAQEVVHLLLFPVTVRFKAQGGEVREETITEVMIRRPKAKDVEAIDTFKGGDVARTLFALTKLTGLLPAQVDQLDSVDIAKLGTIVEGFQPPGQPTGETSSEM